MKRLVLALAVAVSSVVGAAEPVEAPSRALGIFDCVVWLSGDSLRNSRRTWLLGYLSGLNYARQSLVHPTPPDALDQLESHEQAFVWMDDWCKANPIETVGDGGVVLFNELIDRAGKK